MVMATAEEIPGSRYQSFPTSGLLSGNVNVDQYDLIQRIGEFEGCVYCYIVRTVKYEGKRFVQHGSAPNFQGGLITLCTCKWMMRAGRPVEGWPGVWIAGITGAETGSLQRGHLFYLMRVQHAFATHRDLWRWLLANAPGAAEAKVADAQRLGDVYRPAEPCDSPYDPGDYIEPCRDHVHHYGTHRDDWHKDVDYQAFGRRPALLVGDPTQSFLWTEPRVAACVRVGQGSKRADLATLLGCKLIMADDERQMRIDAGGLVAGGDRQRLGRHPRAAVR